MKASQHASQQASFLVRPIHCCAEAGEAYGPYSTPAKDSAVIVPRPFADILRYAWI